MSSDRDRRRLQRRHLPSSDSAAEATIPAPPISTTEPPSSPPAEDEQLPSYESVAHDVPPPVSDAELARNYSIPSRATVEALSLSTPPSNTVTERAELPPDYRTASYLHDPNISEEERRQRQETERWRRINWERRQQRAAINTTPRLQVVREPPKGVKKIWHAIKYI